MAIQTLFGSVPTEPNLLDRLKSGIQKTRAGLVDRIEDVLAGKKEIDAELLEELEYTLITADLGVHTVEDILERIRQRVDRKMTADASEIRALIREQLLEIQYKIRRQGVAANYPGARVLVIEALLIKASLIEAGREPVERDTSYRPVTRTESAFTVLV